MKNLLTSLAFPIIFEKWPGVHTWEFGNPSLKRAMMYFNDTPLPPL